MLYKFSAVLAMLLVSAVANATTVSTVKTTAKNKTVYTNGSVSPAYDSISKTYFVIVQIKLGNAAKCGWRLFDADSNKVVDPTNGGWNVETNDIPGFPLGDSAAPEHLNKAHKYRGATYSANGGSCQVAVHN